jgi:hypothetical protein
LIHLLRKEIGANKTLPQNATGNEGEFAVDVILTIS